MPGIALRGRKAACGLNASQFGDLAQRDLVETLARFDPKLVKMAPAGERAED